MLVEDARLACESLTPLCNQLENQAVLCIHNDSSYTVYPRMLSSLPIWKFALFLNSTFVSVPWNSCLFWDGKFCSLPSDLSKSCVIDNLCDI